MASKSHPKTTDRTCHGSFLFELISLPCNLFLHDINLICANFVTTLSAITTVADSDLHLQSKHNLTFAHSLLRKNEGTIVSNLTSKYRY
jgi:hypothetical protein